MMTRFYCERCKVYTHFKCNNCVSRPKSTFKHGIDDPNTIPKKYKELYHISPVSMEFDCK